MNLYSLPAREAPHPSNPHPHSGVGCLFAWGGGCMVAMQWVHGIKFAWALHVIECFRVCLNVATFLGDIGLVETDSEWSLVMDRFYISLERVCPKLPESQRYVRIEMGQYIELVESGSAYDTKGATGYVAIIKRESDQ